MKVSFSVNKTPTNNEWAESGWLTNKLQNTIQSHLDSLRELKVGCLGANLPVYPWQLQMLGIKFAKIKGIWRFFAHTQTHTRFDLYSSLYLGSCILKRSSSNNFALFFCMLQYSMQKVNCKAREWSKQKQHEPSYMDRPCLLRRDYLLHLVKMSGFGCGCWPFLLQRHDLFAATTTTKLIQTETHTANQMRNKPDLSWWWWSRVEYKSHWLNKFNHAVCIWENLQTAVSLFS